MSAVLVRVLARCFPLPSSFRLFSAPLGKKRYLAIAFRIAIQIRECLASFAIQLSDWLRYYVAEGRYQPRLRHWVAVSFQDSLRRTDTRYSYSILLHLRVRLT